MEQSGNERGHPPGDDEPHSEEERAFDGRKEDVELTELRHRRIREVEDQLRLRRSGDVPEEEGEWPQASDEGEWSPPPEAAPRADRKTAWFRFGLFLLVLLLGWVGFKAVTGLFFTPKLEIVGTVKPDGRVDPNRPARLGLLVRNTKWQDGFAFLVVADDDGSEEEGPVVEVAERDTTLVPIMANLPPGDHVVSLILFDAWKENVRVDAVHGVLVRVGESTVHVLSASVPDSSANGEPLLVEMTVVNEGERDEVINPVVVVVRPPSGETIAEVDGPAFRVQRGDSMNLQFTVDPGTLDPGPYTLTLIAVSDSGERLGSGVHGVPWRVHD